MQNMCSEHINASGTIILLHIIGISYALTKSMVIFLFNKKTRLMNLQMHF